MKSTWERILALTLCMALTLCLLAGCGSNGSNSNPASSGGTPVSSTNESNDTQDEPYTVSVIIPNGTGLSLADEVEVEEAINAITVPKINCKVDLNMISFGQYTDQVNLMLASGEEKMDLFLSMSFMFDTSYMASTGQILPIEEYLDEYGQGIKDALGDYYNAGLNGDGHIYTVAGVRDMAYSNGIIMRKDVMDAAGVDINDIHSLDDIGEMCAKIRETGAWDGAILPSLKDELSYYDDLGGNKFGVIVDYANSLTVVNLFETDEFLDYCNHVRDWYLKGYMDPEGATATDGVQTRCANGILAGYLQSVKPGMAEQETQNTGHEMVAAIWGDDIMSTTSQVNFITWQVAQQCEDPASAIKFLNELYSNPDVANLICYGIEGKHYEFNEDGTVGYPDGVDSTNTGWTFATNWMCGNEFITYLWEGNDLDLWEQTDAYNRSATLPLAFGFTANMDDVATEVAACQSVLDQYEASLLLGELDVESALAELNQKLYASGLQAIIDAKQAQLDAWAAANGITEG